MKKTIPVTCNFDHSKMIGELTLTEESVNLVNILKDKSLFSIECIKEPFELFTINLINGDNYEKTESRNN